MDFQEVPHVKLNGCEKEFALAVLGKGNVLLKKWSPYFGPKKFKFCCMAILNGDDNPLNSIPEDRLQEFRADLPDIRASRSQLFQQLGNRTVEMAILQSCAAMAKKYALKWSSGSFSTGITKSDFLQEAYLQIIQAMYSWLPEFDVQISTFICTALKRRLSKVTNSQGNLLSHLTNSDLKLLIQYRKVNSECGNNFGQLIEQIGLSQEQGRHLELLLKNVVLETELQDKFSSGRQVDPTDNDGDYTGHRSNASEISQTEIMIQDGFVKSTLDKAGLTTLERELIELAMNPFHGWQTEFAMSHINPTTNKPYSRMRITQILEIARGKVASVINKTKAA